jgi:hypothetical protein
MFLCVRGLMVMFPTNLVVEIVSYISDSLQISTFTGASRMWFMVAVGKGGGLDAKAVSDVVTESIHGDAFY